MVAFSATLARQMRSRMLAVLLVMCGIVLVNSLVHGMMDQARIQAASGTENTAFEPSLLNSPMARNLASYAEPPGALQPGQQPQKQPQQQQPQQNDNKNETARHFMVGYGSLLNAKSRAQTSAENSKQPFVYARISGMRRYWNYAQPTRTMTALGVNFQPNFTTNVVIVQVKPEELPLFDKREVKYTRKEVDKKNIQLIEDPVHRLVNKFVIKPADKVWVYIPDEPHKPEPSLPISEAYVDVVLDGCLQVSEEFAREFVRTTFNWLRDGSGKNNGKDCPLWVDDRELPRLYSKDFVSAANKAKIDAILKELLPTSFDARRRECLVKPGEVPKKESQPAVKQPQQQPKAEEKKGQQQPKPEEKQGEQKKSQTPQPPQPQPQPQKAQESKSKAPSGGEEKKH